MKRILAVLLLAPLLAFAKPEPVSFDFASVSLVTFGQATFKAIMHRDFVISADALSMDRKITVSVKSMDAADVPRFVEGILAQQGIVTTLRDGVYYLTSARAQQEATQALQPASMASSPPFAAVSNATAFPTRPTGEFGQQVRRDEQDSIVYSPINRSSDFLVAVLASAFGSQAAMVAGSKVVLTGSKKKIDKMRVFLEALDAAARMLDVSASWVEVTASTESARGISLVANILGAKFGVALGSPSASSSITLRNTNFELVLEALNTDGRFKQISNSRIVGDDFEKFTLNVGDETPTVSSTGKDNSGNSIQNIVYRPSGVIVDVWAKLLGGGKINLVIDGQISSFKVTSNGVSGSPTLIKRQVKTSVTVGDGEVLMIGGLNDTLSTNSISSFPFLPAAWGVKSGSKAQTDLVLILSARVARP